MQLKTELFLTAFQIISKTERGTLFLKEGVLVTE
jgi:hypothetical protein